MKYYSVDTVYQWLTANNIRTVTGLRLINKDVLNGISAMQKKHSLCEWIKYDKNRPTINMEGFYWLVEVYFNNKKSYPQKDIDFFEKQILDYQNICDDYKLVFSVPEYIEKEMTVEELAEFTSRSIVTVRKKLKHLPPQKNTSFMKDGKTVYTKSTCDYFCYNFFKHTYLKYVEEVYLYLKNILLRNEIVVVYDN